MNADSKVEDYSYKEVVDGLRHLKEKFPSVYRWFFIWTLEELHGPRQSDPGLDQEQETDSGSA
jgi:hypothetical protein